jgi:hypothetical protein
VKIHCFVRILVVGLTFAFHGTAQAWTRSGHMVTAAIAYFDLGGADSPIIERIVEIMDSHPEPGPFQVAIGRATGAERTQRIFLEIPRWADDIRGSEYDHPTWHYLFRPITDQKNPPPNGVPYAYSGAAPEALALNINVARNPRALVSERAIALCWIFHIVGDIHQPLHAAEYFSAQMPEGDFAGDKFYLIDPQTQVPVKLHRFWDDLVYQSDEAKDVLGRGQELMTLYPRARFSAELGRDKVKAADIGAWAAESHALAADVAYRADRPTSTSLSQASLPNAKYVADSTSSAELRLTLAGYRLADVLRSIFEGH